MRLLPTFYSGKGAVSTAKKVRAQVEHIPPPVNGLSMAAQFSANAPQTATLLQNMYVNEDSLTCRAGYRKLATRGTDPVWCLIPWYGSPNAIAAASNGELWDAQNGNRIKGGFTSNDWHWTSFSNLGEGDYTVMVNGSDGVWSWNGNLIDDTAGNIPGTNLTSANPAVVTVAAGDVGKFTVGGEVYVAGATGTGTIKANGYRIVTAITGSDLTLNIDTSGGGTQASGVTLNPTTGVIKEVVTGPAGVAWVQPSGFNVVISHQNRLFFADKTNLAVYYLPIQQKSGEVKVFPLNAMFRRGGSIKAMYTWTIDGGAGMDDLLVIFSTNGECVIYEGTDPATNFSLKGIFRFDSPMSKHAVAQYGGELYVLISTGLVPLSTMLRAESDQLGESDKAVTSLFLRNAISFRDTPGWSTFLNPSTGRMFCNIPQGAPNRYEQYIRHMPKSVWSTFKSIPARCWGWLDPFVYFADDDGNVYEMHPRYKNDNGQAIVIDVQTSWSTFRTTSKKRFLVIQAYITSDGAPRPIIDIKVDFDTTKGTNTPDLSTTTEGAAWETGTWDVDLWTGGETAISIWNGVSGVGRVGAVRMTAEVQDATFSINGWDIVFEAGAFT